MDTPGTTQQRVRRPRGEGRSGRQSSLSRRARLAEVGRFMVVGALATAVALVLFNLLVHGFGTGRTPLADNPVAAYVVANTVGMLISYQGSRSYVFRDRSVRAADGGFTAYVVINVATMALPVACLVLSRGLLGLDSPLADNISANGVGLVLGLGARFVLFRSLVFRLPDEAPGLPVVGPALSVLPTATATSGPDAPPAPAAAAG